MADDVIYVNTEDGLKRLMNNTKVYIKVLGKFKDDDSFKIFETAMAEGDMEKAKVAVHTLKGLAANLSLTELAKQALELELQMKGGYVDLNQATTVKNVYYQTLIEAEKVIAQYA